MQLPPVDFSWSRNMYFWSRDVWTKGRIGKENRPACRVLWEYTRLHLCIHTCVYSYICVHTCTQAYSCTYLLSPGRIRSPGERVSCFLLLSLFYSFFFLFTLFYFPTLYNLVLLYIFISSQWRTKMNFEWVVWTLVVNFYFFIYIN